jgi:hypothetical protein
VELEEKVNDMEERIQKIETQLATNVACHMEKINKLGEWQTKQNGSLQRLEQKIDGIYTWLIGLLGGIIATFIMLVFNLLGRR